MTYRCPECGKRVERKSTKATITSYCATKGKSVQLVKVKR